LQPFEEPDFLTTDCRLGVEIVELRNQYKTEHAGRLSLVVREAMRLYNGREDAPYIRVFFDVASDLVIGNVKRLARTLADHVYERRHQRGLVGDDGLPVGLRRLEISDPLGVRGKGSEWGVSGRIDSTLGSTEAVAAIINDKNQLVAGYRNRSRAQELWLLIVVDGRLSTGEVVLTPAAVMGHSFRYDFDKVLILFRQLEGGQVVEVPRSHADE